MSATQLLRILQTLPACAEDDNEVGDFNTDELEANTNTDSRCTNPFLSNEEDNQVNYWTNRPELEISTFGNQFTNNHKDVPFRRPSALAKTAGFRIDKHSVECDLPELIVCYKESDFRVKDISINDDEEISDEETISVHKDNNHESLYNSCPVNGGDDMIEASLDTEFPNNEWLRSSTMSCCYMADELTNICEEKLNLSTSLQDDLCTHQLASNSKISLQQDWSQKPLEFPVSSNLYDDDINQHPLQGSKDKQRKRAIVGSVANIQKNIFDESKIEEGVAFHFDTRKKREDSNPCGSINLKSTHELTSETESVVNQQDAASDYKLPVNNHETRYVEGESSFSMAGVISELISSCSRPMPLAVGISTRSDSSATSTRSFAFPT
ncbi:putative protein BREAKING OF ASYMMETRY IN THE STOMATAL LINEAGE [Helianthus annuus]|nr:putative protein BREAKING OF ASYMMETRY IN THE STOMATAL LINEAGE [Helianthus annuus]KAJ0454991.1 putative protein BREAKING OF ASYMMETRY IN THE STOMATAL LINEAGE [Helianthus annuus]KAJ0472587.1 putative protein BREAKING OF ASYMMETRY IN THE STOMATAL LINEAGE [Helianthus annuus]KAJ0648192.1 putative protein BREAKING OF ASYMMETRY IN THE STOMATAL LINEAGE [Helianthus annuus]KAJ0652035.1 putative protein BREAKING OF ASYMMETRY IN THE STOMATAL LINEAGE [Helianthus annuus]